MQSISQPIFIACLDSVIGNITPASFAPVHFGYAFTISQEYPCSLYKLRLFGRLAFPLLFFSAGNFHSTLCQTLSPNCSYHIMLSFIYLQSQWQCLTYYFFHYIWCINPSVNVKCSTFPPLPLIHNGVSRLFL